MPCANIPRHGVHSLVVLITQTVYPVTRVICLGAPPQTRMGCLGNLLCLCSEHANIVIVHTTFGRPIKPCSAMLPGFSSPCAFAAWRERLTTKPREGVSHE